MKKTFIIPYYGEWPIWFNHFLYTCSVNKDSAFLFFTDIPVPAEIPANVVFHTCSFDQIVSLASEKIGVKITIAKPYKLCDLKPMYGKIFEDYIQDSDYWGHLDIDVLLGDLSHFLNDSLIKGYDVISSRKEMINGSLSLYKNTALVNEAYLHIPFVVDMVNDTKSHYLDEYYFTRTLQMIERKGKINMLFKEFIEEDALNEIRGKRAWALLFSDGKATDVVSGNYIAYIHFIHSKSKPFFKNSFPTVVNKKFLLTENGYKSYSTNTYYKTLIHCYTQNAVYYIKRFAKKKMGKA